MSIVTLEELMEAGVHFGHQTKRWNPKMKPFIWGKRNGIYIIDLTKTVPLLEQAYNFVRDQSAIGKRVVFVGTKKQAADIVAEEAARCGAQFVNKRWLGGTLTNAGVIRTRINRYRELEEMEANGYFDKLGKKEAAVMRRQLAKFHRALGGLKDMRGAPDLLVVVDQKRELNAVMEAQKAGVPVVCLLDTNCDPSLCEYNIPGNDDAIKALRLILGKLADAVIEGRSMREKNVASRKDSAGASAASDGKELVAVGASASAKVSADAAVSADAVAPATEAEEA
jgi:small subunit ribosomal protein S2